MISVIIPVYNIEKYLKCCVDSVIGQSYKDIEIILVDDGSTDNSGRICDEYAVQDTRVRVVHRENGGLSAARNTGIECATGEYLFFLDGDDAICAKTLELLLHTLEKDDCDLVFCGRSFVDEAAELLDMPKVNNIDEPATQAGRCFCLMGTS